MAINFLNTVAVDEKVLFVDTVNSRVGIGTQSPEVGLHLSGTGLPASFSITDTAITNESYDTMRFFAATLNKFAIGVGSATSYPSQGPP